MGLELTEQITRHLDNDLICWLTTVSPSGRPAPRPVWFVWDGLVISVYSLNTGAKLKHIATNDQVSINFNATPTGGDVVVIAGTAEVVPDAPPPSRFPGLMRKYGPTIAGMGRSEQWYDDSYGVLIRITPDGAWWIPG